MQEKGKGYVGYRCQFVAHRGPLLQVHTRDFGDGDKKHRDQQSKHNVYFDIV